MENAQDKLNYKFGLVGKDISYSFSRGYFADKFKKGTFSTNIFVLSSAKGSSSMMIQVYLSIHLGFNCQAYTIQIVQVNYF